MAHKSAVRHRLAERSERIEVFLLPGYTLGLNPDELLKLGVKSSVLSRHRPAKPVADVYFVRTYLQSTQRRPGAVRSYF